MRTTETFDALADVGQPPQPERPLSVSELTSQVKDLLEGSFPEVWVAGEISNCARPQSGHVYLTLKDERAQLRAVMWRGKASRVPFELEDGLEVICGGHLDVYAQRGSYQLVIEQIQPKGIGALELALRKLREKLAKEGLFDEGRKRPLPAFPKRIAFVTSPTGAAIQDFLKVVRRRWRGARVLVVPCRVQGDGAAAEIARGIEQVNQLDVPIDVMVVGRGGGSLEDLWAFNEEVVVRAIAASQVPVVSAVGHEIDVTLSDLVADLRALTPTEAAERVVPSEEDVRGDLASHAQRLVASMRNRTATARGRLNALAGQRALRKPLERIHDLARRLDELAARAGRSVTQRHTAARARADALAGKFESLSPLGVLRRGYSLTYRGADGPPIRRAAELQTGDLVTTRFAEGEATSRVEKTGDGARQ